MNEPLISCQSSHATRSTSEMTNERKLTVEVWEAVPVPLCLPTSLFLLVSVGAAHPCRFCSHSVLRWFIRIFGPGGSPDHCRRTRRLVTGQVMSSWYWLHPSLSLVAAFKALFDSLDSSRLCMCTAFVHFWGLWRTSPWAWRVHARWSFRKIVFKFDKNLSWICLYTQLRRRGAGGSARSEKQLALMFGIVTFSSIHC